MTTRNDEKIIEKNTLLDLENVSVFFGDKKHEIQVTHDVSFSIGRNETVALVGESGSGKTVTAMSIIDLLPETARASGDIEFDGKNLLGLSASELNKVRASNISIIFQDPMTALNPVYTIGQLMNDSFFGQDLSKDEARKQAIDLLNRVRIPEPEQKIDQYPHQLSGGQRQRVMIAMALSSNPDLLIADEPTTALDVTVQAGILDLLNELQDQFGMGILLITHDMGVVADVADHVHVMKDGNVVESAPTEKIFSSPQHPYTKQLLASVPELGTVDHTEKAQRTEQTPSLKFENVVVEFDVRGSRDKFRAVDEVSFDLYPGEVLGLVGESGSGKSTLGRVAVGLQKAASGRAEISGIDLTQASRAELREVRRNVSVVFQDPASSLDPRMTISQSVVAPLKWNKIMTKSSALKQRSRELLDMVKIPASWTDRYPHELSGGQRQRVGIARALALDPKVLIADEPTSALDVSVQARVLELLEDLQHDLGFSCVFISHDLAVVEQLAHRVVVLRQGRVVEAGSVEQVLFQPQDPYTQRLVAAAPVPNPEVQAERRRQRLELLKQD